MESLSKEAAFLLKVRLIKHEQHVVIKGRHPIHRAHSPVNLHQPEISNTTSFTKTQCWFDPHVKKFGQTQTHCEFIHVNRDRKKQNNEAMKVSVLNWVWSVATETCFYFGLVVWRIFISINLVDKWKTSWERRESGLGLTPAGRIFKSNHPEAHSRHLNASWIRFV